nr:MAG TPA: hypothetical protein [Caudoviricetes sp.]
MTCPSYKKDGIGYPYTVFYHFTIAITATITVTACHICFCRFSDSTFRCCSFSYSCKYLLALCNDFCVCSFNTCNFSICLFA